MPQICVQIETNINSSQSYNEEVFSVQEPAEQMNTVKQAVKLFKLLKEYWSFYHASMSMNSMNSAIGALQQHFWWN